MKKSILILPILALALASSQALAIKVTNNAPYDLNFWTEKPSQEKKPTLIKTKTTEEISTKLEPKEFFWNNSKTSGSYNKTDKRLYTKLTIKEDGTTYIPEFNSKAIREQKSSVITDQDIKKIEEKDAKDKAKKDELEAELKNPKLQEKRNLNTEKQLLNDNIKRQQEMINSCKANLSGNIGSTLKSSYQAALNDSEKKLKDFTAKLNDVEAKLNKIEAELKATK
jgi:hypothetical protein